MWEKDYLVHFNVVVKAQHQFPLYKKKEKKKLKGPPEA